MIAALAGLWQVYVAKNGGLHTVLQNGESRNRLTKKTLFT